MNNSLIIEGGYARYFHSKQITKLPVNIGISSRMPVTISRYLSCSRQPKNFYETLLLYDNVITYGPSVVRFPYSKYTHVSPFDPVNIFDSGKPYGVEWLSEEFHDEGKFGKEIITPDLLCNVLQSKYYIADSNSISKYYSGETTNLPGWSYLNLTRNDIFKIINLCSENSEVIFSRIPKGLELYSDPDDGFLIVNEKPSWVNLKNQINEIFQEKALKGELICGNKKVPKNCNISNNNWVSSIMADLHNAYYYLDGLLIPWRLGKDILSSNLFKIGNAPNNLKNTTPDTFAIAKLFISDIEFWPAPRSFEEYQDYLFQKDIVVLRESFHNWKKAMLWDSDSLKNKSAGDIKLAAKSLKKLKFVRKIKGIEAYAAGILGNIPFSSPFLSAVSILLNKIELNEIKNLGAMGVRVI